MKRIIRKLLCLFLTIIGVFEWFVKRIFRGGWTYSSVQTSVGRKLKILANGPSLLEDLASNREDDADYLMLNYAVKSDLFYKLKPIHYILIDPLFFQIDIKKNEPFIKTFMNIDWNMQLYVPSPCVKIVQKVFHSNKFIKVCPVPTSIPTNIKIRSVRNFFFIHYLAAPPLQNVVVGAIYSAIMRGYKNIELFGVGHSWTSQLIVDDSNQVCMKDHHFYDNRVTLEPYLKTPGQPYKLHELLRAFAQMFESYWDLRYFADTLGGVRIINKTRGSFIDAFDREYD